MARAKPREVSDELRAVIEPLLPQRQRRFRHPGRKRLDDRLRYGSGMTCWRRLRVGRPGCARSP
nr:hypothetical protein [Nonomuraea sp. SYSU D8015]